MIDTLGILVGLVPGVLVSFLVLGIVVRYPLETMFYLGYFL